MKIGKLTLIIILGVVMLGLSGCGIIPDFSKDPAAYEPGESVQGGYFTPDVPEGDGLYLFERPTFSAKKSTEYATDSFMVLHGEKVRVDKLLNNGWVELTYINPKDGMEHTGYNKMKMLVPVPGDENAAALKAEYDSNPDSYRQMDLETQVIFCGIILVAVGFIITFMSFLKHIRSVLLVLITLAVSALEIWFLFSGSKFTYILPSVVGWKWAIIWFACFAAFFLAQIFLFIRAIDSITAPDKDNIDTPRMGLYSIGMNVIVMICVVVFYALYLLAAIFADIIWKPLTVPFAWVDQHLLWFFLGAQVLIVIHLIRECDDSVKTRLQAIFFITPVYLVGFAAIALMFQQLLTGALVGLGSFVLIKLLMQPGSGKFAPHDYSKPSGTSDPMRYSDGTYNPNWKPKSPFDD